MLRKILKASLLTLAGFLVLLAICSGIVRGLTPLVGEHRAEFETFISHVLHQPVKIHKIQTTWSGIEPVFRLSDVTVYSQNYQKALLQVDELDLSIDLIDSLFHLRLMPGHLTLRGANLTVRQDAQGQFTVDGISRYQKHKQQTATGHHPGHLLNWIFSQDAIHLEDVDIYFIAQDNTVLPITHLDLSVVNNDDQHKIEGKAQLSQTIPSRFSFRGNFNGDDDDLSNWRGSFFVNVKDFLVNQWFHNLQYDGIHATNGDLAFQLWGTLRAGEITQARALLNVKNLNLLDENDHYHQLIQHISTQLFYEEQTHGWFVKADKMKIKTAGHTWPMNNFTLRKKEVNGKTQHELNLAHVRIDDIRGLLLATTVFPNNSRELISALQPLGYLQNIHWKDIDGVWDLAADFRQVTWQAHDKIPAVDNISGHLTLKPDEGAVHLYSHKLNISEPALYEKALVFDDVFTDVHWQRENGAWKILFPDLLIKNKELTVTGKVGLRYQKNDSHLSLLLGYTFKDIKKLVAALPEKSMSPKLTHWLHEAFLSGAGDGKITYEGKLSGFPQNHEKNKFNAILNFHGLDLAYWPGWPKATQVDSTIILDDDGLSASITSGKLLDTQINHIEGSIHDLRPGHRVLNIQGGISGDASAIVRYMLHTPLRKKFAVLNNTMMHGPASLDNDISLPFQDTTKNMKMQGALHFNQVNLLLPASGFSVKNIKGQVGFTSHQFTGDKLTATVYSKPMTFAMRTKKINKIDQLQFSTKGTVALDHLKKMFHQNNLKYVSGKTQYKANLNVPLSPRGTTQLNVYSDLRGIESTLPKPLTKSVSTKWPLVINTALLKNSTRVNYRVNKHFSGALNFKKDGTVQAASVHFGQHKAKPLASSGISIGGETAELPLDQWIAAYKKFTATKNASSVPTLNTVKLKVGRLDLYGNVFHQMQINAKQHDKSWWLKVDSPELSGTMNIPHSKAAIEAHLSQLTLTKKQADSVRLNVDARKLPGMDLEVDNFVYNKKSQGRVALRTQPKADGIMIDKFAITNKAYHLSGHGMWLQRHHSDQTALTGTFSTTNLAESLKRWDVTPAINSKRGVVQFNLYWPTSPFNVSQATMNGNIHVKLQHGDITHLNKETENKIALGKLLSILSLQTLPRRLILDFSDLSSKNFNFSILTGDFTLKKGTAYTKNTYLDGPVAYVSLHGSVGLASQKYNMILKVAPHITASLPIVAGIAGGPIALVVTWVASNIVNQQMKKVSSYTYEITGPWKSPNIKQLKITAYKASKKSMV